MKLKYLALSNFRAYIGDQRIDFSTSDENKITLVEAESGFGKSTLIRAFKWVLVDDSGYNDSEIINHDVVEQLAVGESASVSVEVSLDYRNSTYVFRKTQKFNKTNSRLMSDKAFLTLRIKDEDGTTQPEKTDNDARKFAREIIPQDLFDYFFLEGESLNKVGKQIAKSKGGNNSFSKAVKGLLGFTFLYNAQKHLNQIHGDYQEEIKKNLDDDNYKTLISRNQEIDKQLSDIDERIPQLEEEKDKFDDLFESTEQQVSLYKDVEEKQIQVTSIEADLRSLTKDINDLKKNIFEGFSKDGLFYFSLPLISKANEILKNSHSIEKSIPGLDAKAINAILEKGECICGHKFQNGDDAYNHLKELLKFIPPTSVGTDIVEFQGQIKHYTDLAERFKSEFDSSRRKLHDKLDTYNEKNDKLQKLNEEIRASGNLDVKKLKDTSREYQDKIYEIGVELRSEKVKKDELLAEKKSLEVKIKNSSINNAKVQKLINYDKFAVRLKESLEKFCDQREQDKKSQLEQALNEIFNKFYDNKNGVKLYLDPDYCLIIKDQAGNTKETFASGGQEVVLALAFIGAVVKLNGENSKGTYQSEADNKEVYPLVMDAPVSNFGEKQYVSFCENMPSLTNQMIIFVNDIGASKLREKLTGLIGQSYEIKQLSTWQSQITKEA